MELILTILYFIVGGLIGADSLQANLGTVLGLTNETLAAIPLKYITGGLFLPL